VSPPAEFPPTGKRMLQVLKSDTEGQADPERTAIFVGRERHSSSRFHSLSYPQRAIRTSDYLFIRNFRPERWPAGTPRKYDRARFQQDGQVQGTLGPIHGGYHDIDACPSLDFLIKHHNHPQYGRYLQLAVAKRPAEEMFDIRNDPGCLHNLADDPAHIEITGNLRAQLLSHLQRTGDERVSGNGDVWETYPRVSKLRWFEVPGWAQDSPELVPNMDWLEQRRPVVEE